jgi:spoIIIJ-associated protein
MEWVETTGKTVEDAKERALDQLGVADDDAEFEVLEEPRAGLFGLIRGEARVRARIRPTEARPKQERRRGKGRDRAAGAADASVATATVDTGDTGDTADTASDGAPAQSVDNGDGAASAPAPRPRRDDRSGRSDRNGGRGRRDDDRSDPNLPPVEPAVVGEAAVAFMDGLVDAFGLAATTSLSVDGTELEIRVDGADLGLLIGPGGRTLLAVQDLARVAAQRRLGDHETRLRIDVAGYRERRREALERFVLTVADDVVRSGTARALEPMPSADRKVVHDVLTTVDGVSSHSEGDDPARRVVITPTATAT